MTKRLRAVTWASVSSRPQAAEDKVSLEEQERLNVEWCERNHADIVDRLVIPGHSRYESDLFDLLDDYAQQGIWAYHKIREHWKKRDFDVLVCYHDSRFGRSATVYNWVGENTIRAGARIYRHLGGWIDAKNSPFQLALGTIAATNSLAQLVEGRKSGMKKRAQNGLPTSSGVPMTHILLRNHLGKAERLVVDEGRRRLWDDFATLFLEGVGWRSIEHGLYARYGHVTERGTPWPPLRFYTLFTNPTTHGHSAQYHRRKDGRGLAPIGEWILEPGHDIPDGVEIYYHTHEAVWTGELFERLKAEFRRRQSIRGSASPTRTNRFSGLLLCGECRYYLVTANNTYSKGLRCMSHYNQSATHPDCSQTAWIHARKVETWLTNVLSQIAATGDWTPLAGPSLPQSADRLAAVEAEIADLKDQITTLIVSQSKAKSVVLDLYEQQIVQAGERLEILEKLRDSLRFEAATSEREQRERDGELQTVGDWAAFWKRPDREINQVLRRILGHRRLVVLDGLIIGSDDAPPYRRRP